ncbi:MAG: hypothetical protein SFU55_06860 [Methylophilus sp.]|nr:hypothetical protein [Methylophilus sp.]
MRNFFLVLTAPLLLNACGEFSYKRGASATDLQKTKQICQKAVNGETVEQCLKKNGWVVQKLDNLSDIDLFATASITNDNRSTDGAKSIETSAASSEASTPNNTLTSKSPSNAPEPKPTDLYSISSWWKMGGSDSKLKADISQCVDTLGEDHKPDIAAQKYTRALVICMHQKGWTALKNAK